MDKEMKIDKLCVSFSIFILCMLLLTCSASAQCEDCDDKNPCTKDLCDGMRCQHMPQSCDEGSSFSWAHSLIGADIGTTDIANSSIQNNLVPSVLDDAIDTSASCDDNNPCTKDSYGENGCINDPVNCDDGSSCTYDYCGANGCVHDPIDCDDGCPCTSDYCSANGCIHDPVNCDDSSLCTFDYCGTNGCIHDPVNCDDGNASTADICGPSGCINSPLLGDSSDVSANTLEFLSPVIPEIQNKTERENTTNNESQSGGEMAKALPICDDDNPCTTDSYNGTGCIYASLDCNDGNDSTFDSCRDGACINEPINIVNIIAANNSTAVSSSEALFAGHPRSCDDHDPCTIDTLNGTECEHNPKICNDGNDSTFDYCYGGECYNTTTSCDDGNNCTTDKFNGNVCVHTPKNCDDIDACTIDTCDEGKCVHTPKNCDDGNPCTYDKCDHKIGCYNTWKCNDGNPCTIDYCDPVWGCLHSPVVCRDGKTCINGVCQYPYYTYAAPYYPYAAPTSPLPSTNSYTIPAGTAVTLPWGQSVTALNTLKVENGITYPSASPLRFARMLGENQAISVNQMGQSISEQAEMIGLSWKDARSNLTLIQPNGSALPAQGDNQNVVHLVGSNYDYYFLSSSAAKGNWSIEVKPIIPSSNGVGFSLITGLVKGAIP